jgi:hypothetical protein
MQPLILAAFHVLNDHRLTFSISLYLLSFNPFLRREKLITN